MASISGNAKIVLKGKYTDGGAEHEEGILDAAATPGMNVALGTAAADQEVHHWYPDATDYVGTGTDTTVSKGTLIVVKEDALQGRTITDAYASGDRVFLHKASPGEHLQVLVLSGQDISKGDGLSAGSDGKFIADTTNPVVQALESSGGALSADAHLRVLVL